MDRALADHEPAPPAPASAGADVVRSGRLVDGEPEVLLRPRGLRVKGPGRKELAYQQRIADLEEGLAVGEDEGRLARRELEVARLVERGTGRLADRLEVETRRQRAELEEARGQGHRLLVALGGLQQENEALRGELEAARRQLAAPARRGPWRRLLGR